MSVRNKSHKIIVQILSRGSYIPYGGMGDLISRMGAWGVLYPTWGRGGSCTPYGGVGDLISHMVAGCLMSHTGAWWVLCPIWRSKGVICPIFGHGGLISLMGAGGLISHMAARTKMHINTLFHTESKLWILYM